MKTFQKAILNSLKNNRNNKNTSEKERRWFHVTYIYSKLYGEFQKLLHLWNRIRLLGTAGQNKKTTKHDGHHVNYSGTILLMYCSGMKAVVVLGQT